MQPYTTKQGDTWDTIAFEKYGNEKLCHLLMQANPEYLRQDIIIFSAGVTLTIPDGPDAEYSEAPSLFQATPMTNEIPQSLQELIDDVGVMVSRSHGDLTDRNKPNQHVAGAILYKDKPLDAALETIEAKLAKMGEVVVHNQPVASTVWTLVHNLGRRKPEYRITGTDGVEVVGAVNWDEADENQFIVRFLMPVAGTAEVWL